MSETSTTGRHRRIWLEFAGDDPNYSEADWPRHPEDCTERQTWCRACGCCEHCYHPCDCAECDCRTLADGPTPPVLRESWDDGPVATR